MNGSGDRENPSLLVRTISPAQPAIVEEQDVAPEANAEAPAPQTEPAPGEPFSHPFEARLLSDLKVPEGFTVSVVAQHLQDASMMGVFGDHVFVTRPKMGDVVRLVDEDGDGVAESSVTVVAGLKNVHGIAFLRDWVFLSTDARVYRASVSALGEFQALMPIVSDLPASCLEPHRGVGVGPDSLLYISIASDCQSTAANPEQSKDYGILLRTSIDGRERDVFARGLRKTLGFGWQPATGELWGMDESSNRVVGDLPPEELNRIELGQDYGSPYCYGQRQVEPEGDAPADTTKEEYCAGTTPSLLDYTKQGGALGMAFYTGTAFPADYAGDAFVALHGSSKQSPPSGYSILRVRFDDGKPVGFEDFVTGFLMDNTMQFGRPTGVTVASDGSLLFSDDQNGIVYRVAYTG